MTENRGIYINDALRHPIRAFKIAVRRWLKGMAAEIHTVKMDEHGEIAENDIPEYLQQFAEKELIPIKGVKFRVGKVVGGDFPCLMLVPTGLTDRRKIDTIKHYRREVLQRHVG